MLQALLLLVVNSNVYKHLSNNIQITATALVVSHIKVVRNFTIYDTVNVNSRSLQYGSPDACSYSADVCCYSAPNDRDRPTDSSKGL